MISRSLVPAAIVSLTLLTIRLPGVVDAVVVDYLSGVAGIKTSAVEKVAVTIVHEGRQQDRVGPPAATVYRTAMAEVALCRGTQAGAGARIANGRNAPCRRLRKQSGAERLTLWAISGREGCMDTRNRVPAMFDPAASPAQLPVIARGVDGFRQVVLVRADRVIE